MPDCDACGLSLNGSVNFCPRCGSPQNEAAAKRLHDYVEQKAAQVAETEDSGTGTALADRVSYLVGYVTIIVAFAVASDVRTVLFLLGGIVILPPVGRLVGRLVGQSLDRRIRAAVFLLLVVAGTAAGQFL
jgi:hypothetical protein